MSTVKEEAKRAAREKVRKNKPASATVGQVGNLSHDSEAAVSEEPLASWPVLDAAALHGLPGEIVNAIAPTTEADPVAILGQLLVGFGNAVGRGPYFPVEDSKHRMNEFLVLVGDSAKSRKGTSWRRVRAMLEPCDPTWLATRVMGGLSSGPGLIEAVSDLADKRLCAVEGEFATILRQTQNDGNTLSCCLRQAWDGDDLQTINRKFNSLTAKGPHISAIAHSTRDELLRLLDATERTNGFANRFLFLLVRRARLLADGGHLADFIAEPLKQRLKRAFDKARNVLAMTRDQQAAALWRQIYSDLSEARPGMIGSLSARAEAHTLRLSCMFALLDGSAIVRTEHLRAGAAVWEYADQSVSIIFGDSRELRERAKFILQHKDWQGRVTVRDFQHSNGRKWITTEAARSGLNQLVNAGYGRWEAFGKTERFAHHQAAAIDVTQIVPAEDAAPAQPPMGEGELDDAGAPSVATCFGEGEKGRGGEGETIPSFEVGEVPTAVPVPTPGVDEPSLPLLAPGEAEPITVAPRVVPEPVPLAPMPAPPVVRALSVFSLDVPAETRDLLIRAGIRTLGEAIDRELTEDLPDGLNRQQRARLSCALETAAFRNSSKPSPVCSECGRDIGLDDREGRPRKCFECQRKVAFGDADGWQAIPLGNLLDVIPLRECERLQRAFSVRNLGDLHDAVERNDFKAQEAERYRVIIEDARSAAVGSGSRQTIPFAPPAESQPSANGNGHAAAPVKRGRKAKVQA